MENNEKKSNVEQTNISTWDCYVMMKKWMENRNNGKSIGGYLEKYPYKKLAIYGAGDLGKLVLFELQNSSISICYIIDRMAEAIKSENGIPVVLLQDIKYQEQVDAILVTPLVDYTGVNRALVENDIMIPAIALRDLIYEIQESE